MPVIGAAAVALAAGLDLAAGEPPERIHPVAWYGRAVGALDRPWDRPRPVGALLGVGLPTLAAAAAAGAVALAARLDPRIGAVLAGLFLFSTVSLRMLLGVAREVVGLAGEDPDAARERLPALVGRDPAALSPAGMRSAAVESAAENLADGLVAPLLAFAALAPVSLALAAGGAAWVKAVNTADSMLGYPGEPVGAASARLDDAVMFVPARLSAALLALAARDPLALARARRWAREPPSPNSGWPMATLAAVLAVRLEKPGAYALGSGELPTATQARRGIRIVGIAGGLAFAGAGVIAWS
ncbi:MAG: adenosylcobinamide-phosphate synthase CbiB [Halobacteriales archaeon]